MLEELKLKVKFIPDMSEINKILKDRRTGVISAKKIASYTATTAYHPAPKGRLDEKKGLMDVLGTGKGRILSWFEKKSLLWQERDKKFKLKMLGVLGGIAYNLTRVPSILRGVLKMLDFGFLLILKPLADLLAMILLPIASLVIKFGLALGKLSGSSFVGMIAATVIGLILSIVTALAAISLGTKLIGVAIETLVAGSIGATLVTLAPALLGGAIVGMIAKALGATDNQALGITLTSGIALAILGLTFAEVAVVIGVAAATIIALKFLNSLIFETTGIDIGQWLQNKIIELLPFKSKFETETPGYTWKTYEDTSVGKAKDMLNINLYVNDKRQNGTSQDTYTIRGSTY